MNLYVPTTNDTSPFHAGEQALQTRAGKREQMEHFGRRVIRDYMPDQHREFYAQLPFLVVGAVDDNGDPWATLLTGKPGFVSSPDARTLEMNADERAGDAAAGALRAGRPVGLLGIELPTRRRNRMNGRVVADGERLTVRVDQAFGNCPQYIQSREIVDVADRVATVEPFTGLPAEARAFVARADTFFVSSYVPADESPDIEGVDVSHRGGQPGFVKVEGNTLTVPDFPGNNHFNTLGNFLLNPKAGLVFPDFETGDLWQLSGTVTLLDEDDPAVSAFRGAERAWRVTVTKGVRLGGAVPFRFGEAEPSPNNVLTDSWAAADARLEAEARRDAWRAHRVVKIEDESVTVRSFYLAPVDGGAALEYQAGQHLPIRVTRDERVLIRTYTLSSAPADSLYRISVKREDAGEVSRYLHDHVAVGDVLEARGPQGAFYLDTAATRPVLLIGGGVGVTPMVSMARHIAHEAVRTRQWRPTTIFHAARTLEEQAFAHTFKGIARASGGAVRYVSLLSEADPAEADVIGHLDADVLRAVLALDDYEAYLCGPPGFMQAAYDALRSLGVADERIHAESFGPSALVRDVESATAPSEPEIDAAVIAFTKSGFEQPWHKGDGTLLEVAEAHGLQPEFSCRGGSCGTCATRLEHGEVTNRHPVSAAHDENEILICSAVPATARVEIDL